MKKQEVYKPLFETEDIEAGDIEKVTCVCCGKTIKQTLINNDGICVECIMNNRINSDDVSLLPNENLFHSFFNQYKQYLKTKPKDSALVAVAGAALGLLGAAIVASATYNSKVPERGSKFDYVNKKIKLSTFEKCNKMTISIRNESWICPCCNNDNSGAHFCTVCGVYPKFKLEE